jgi:hypothetical protein
VQPKSNKAGANNVTILKRSSFISHLAHTMKNEILPRKPNFSEPVIY